MSFKKFAGEKFRSEDQDGINCAAPYYGQMLEQLGERTPIDREHPQGGLSHELPFPPAQGRKCGKYNFKAPSKKAAFTKVSQ